VGAIVLVLAIWLLVSVLIARADVGNLQDQLKQQTGDNPFGALMLSSMAFQVSLGIGGFLNVAAAALVAAGAILKACEEKLF
jgi:cytochrome b